MWEKEALAASRWNQELLQLITKGQTSPEGSSGILVPTNQHWNPNTPTAHKGRKEE
jgi:hypothetical protein